MMSLPDTCAKSLTLFKNLFAILGVPLDLEAISIDPSSLIETPRISALLFTIDESSSFVYGSSLKITPNLSLKGAVS